MEFLFEGSDLLEGQPLRDIETDMEAVIRQIGGWSLIEEESGGRSGVGGFASVVFKHGDNEGHLGVHTSRNPVSVAAHSLRTSG